VTESALGSHSPGMPGAIRSEMRRAVRGIALGRPDKRNALNRALREADAKGAVRALVLAGAMAEGEALLPPEAVRALKAPVNATGRRQ